MACAAGLERRSAGFAGWRWTTPVPSGSHVCWRVGSRPGRRRSADVGNAHVFAAELNEGHRSLDFLKRPLLPYQVEGVLHLAFGERALLADDMGLGKTVQAIAACTLLRELRGIERVLVVAPASLKAEWEEQIATFSDLPATVVFGGPVARRAAYERGVFFTLCNYEQVVVDRRELVRDVPARCRDPRRSPSASRTGRPGRRTRSRSSKAATPSSSPAPPSRTASTKSTRSSSF